MQQTRILKPHLAAMSFCLVFLLAPADAFSTCIARDFSIWPPADVKIPTNGIIVLFGLGAPGEMIDSISDFKPALVEKDVSVPLRVLRRFEGGNGRRAVLLRPEKELNPHTKYRLRLHGLDALKRQKEGPGGLPPSLIAILIRFVEILEWFGRGCASRPDVWDALENRSVETGDGSDLTPPTWGKLPAVYRVPAEQKPFHREPFVLIESPAFDNLNQIAYVAEVTEEADNSKPVAAFPFPHAGGWIRIYSFECSDVFSLKDGVEYTATLTAIDMAGNEAKAPGAPLRFTSPGRVPGVLY